MNLEEYKETKRMLYREYAACVVTIIESALAIAGIRESVQQIQSRAKDIESLSRKLKKRELQHSAAIEHEVKDLAGCRIVFYHNDDLNAFLHSGIVGDNFDVSWDDSKIHHPDTAAQSANDYYMANHFLVTLKTDRLALPEFAKFSGLRCEIQAQTLLNHAWSETIHDITYKTPKAQGFGDELMSRIDDRLMTIMTDHLRPAGYEFQKVKRDFAQLVAGQEIFDNDVIDLIGTVEDSNALFELLERYKEYVIPNYSDSAAYSDQIYNVIETALKQARELGDSPIDTPYGSFAGKSHLDILTECLRILSFVRYLDFDRTHEMLVQINQNHVDPGEEDSFAEHVEKIAAYHDDIIQRYGYYVQTRLVEVLGEKAGAELTVLHRYVLAVCRALLTLTISKTEWSYNEVTWGTINLPGTPELGEIRRRALELLITLSKSHDPEIARNAIICMRGATETPRVGHYDDALMDIIVRDTNSVVQFMTENIDKDDLESTQSDEERILAFHRRAQGMLANREMGAGTQKLMEETLALTTRYRDTVDDLSNYHRYKVLVGFRSVFREEWDDDRWGWEAKEKYRQEKIAEYVDSISEKNIADWIRFFSTCSKADPSDMATFQHYIKFLEKFAVAKPDLARQALQDPHARLHSFARIVLLGFDEADRGDLFDAVANEYLDAGEQLWECARAFVLRPLQNREVLHRVFAIAMREENASVLHQVIAAVVTNIERLDDELDTLFLPALRFLTKLKDPGWMRESWFRKEAVTLLQSLDLPSAEVVLDNLVFLPELDYDAERLIVPIAINYPALALTFFGRRLEIENEKDAESRYDAIPYNFQLLSSPLSKEPQLLIDVALSWYRREAKMFQYRGANLVSNTFPKFDAVLEQALLTRTVTGEVELLDFVVAILRNYEGETFLHEVCRQIVMVAEPGGSHIRDVMIILEESGVMRGEYGLADRCSRKKQEISYWLEDESPVVRDFAERYIRGLDRARAAELRRVEEEIELRKHQYD